MPIVYADIAALEAWTGQAAPDNAETLLREASALVRSATRNDLYDATPAGLPVDEDLAEAMRDAACRQAEFWTATDLDPLTGAIDSAQIISSTQVDDAAIVYNSQIAVAVAAERRRTAGSLCPPAFAILRNAGLASAGVG